MMNYERMEAVSDMFWDWVGHNLDDICERWELVRIEDVDAKWVMDNLTNKEIEKLKIKKNEEK